MPIGRNWIGPIWIKRRCVARVLVERRDTGRIDIVIEQLRMQLGMDRCNAAVPVKIIALLRIVRVAVKDPCEPV
jgi:hypothetical protein